MSPHFFLTDNDEYHTLWNTGRYSRADCRTLRPGTHSFDRRNRNLRSVAPRPENNRTPAVAGSLQRLDASRGCDRCSHHLRVRNLRCGRHDMLRGSSGKNLHTLRRSGRRRAGSGVIPAARCHLHASQPDQPLKRRIPEKTKGILFSNFFRHEFAPTFSAFAKNPLERISTTGCHLATGLAHESKYTPLRFGFISSFRTAVALGSAQIYLALPQTCTIFAAWTQRKDIFTSIPETAKARRRPRSDWPCELCAPAKAFTSDSSSSRCDTTKRKSGNSSTK